MTFSVEYHGYGHWVMQDGVPVFGPCQHNRAMDKRDQLERKARQRKRICIRDGCNTEFVSDGPHHRMCGTCRAGASAIYDGAV